MSDGNRGAASLHLSTSIRPVHGFSHGPRKNLLAKVAQEVASERYVAFAFR